MRSLRCRSGFSLIGAMIAMAVFSIGILSFWSLHMAAMANNKLSHRIREATYIANELVSDLKTMNYKDLLLGVTTVTKGPGDNNNGYYIIQKNISNAIPENTRRITITVGWTNRGPLPPNIDQCDRNVEVINFISEISGS